MTDINAYLDFTIGMLLAFGFAFQKRDRDHHRGVDQARSRKTLCARSRPYVFLGAFVIGAIPHAAPTCSRRRCSRCLMYALFEAALFFCWRFLPDR
jgi:Sec-independent protein secretion pathway component TatC